MPPQSSGKDTLHSRFEPDTYDLGRLAQAVLAGHPPNAPALLERLANARECLWIERKAVGTKNLDPSVEAGHHLNVIFEEALGLANLHGGVILVGVPEEYDGTDIGQSRSNIQTTAAPGELHLLLARIWGKTTRELAGYKDPVEAACKAIRQKLCDKQSYQNDFSMPGRERARETKYDLLAPQGLNCEVMPIGFGERAAIAVIVRRALLPLIGRQEKHKTHQYHVRCRAGLLAEGRNSQMTFHSIDEAKFWVDAQRESVVVSNVVLGVEKGLLAERGELKLLALYACEDPPAVLTPDQHPPVGAGAEATVYAAEKSMTVGGQEPAVVKVAVRVAESREGTDSKQIVAEKDRVYLSGKAPPTLVRLFRTWEYQGYRCEEMEFVPGKDCGKLLHDYPFQPNALRSGLPAADIAEIAEGVYSALAYLHQVGLVHRDISFGNVMFSSGGQRPRVRVIDFGKTRFDFQSVRHSGAGTAGFQPPELAFTDYKAPGDVFAAGVLILNLLWGRPGSGSVVYPDTALDEFREKFPAAELLWDRLQEVTSKKFEKRPLAASAGKELCRLLTEFATDLDRELPEARTIAVNASARVLPDVLMPAVAPQHQSLDMTQKGQTPRPSLDDGHDGPPAVDAANANEPAVAAVPRQPRRLSAETKSFAVFMAMVLSAIGATLWAADTIMSHAPDPPAPQVAIRAPAIADPPSTPTPVAAEPQPAAPQAPLPTEQVLDATVPTIEAKVAAESSTPPRSASRPIQVKPSLSRSLDAGTGGTLAAEAKPIASENQHAAQDARQISGSPAQTPAAPVRDTAIAGSGNTTAGAAKAPVYTAPAVGKAPAPTIPKAKWQVADGDAYVIEPKRLRAWEVKAHKAAKFDDASATCRSTQLHFDGPWRLPSIEELKYFRNAARNRTDNQLWLALGEKLTAEFSWSSTKERSSGDMYAVQLGTAGPDGVMTFGVGEKLPFICVKTLSKSESSAPDGR